MAELSTEYIKAIKKIIFKGDNIENRALTYCFPKASNY